MPNRARARASILRNEHTRATSSALCYDAAPLMPGRPPADGVFVCLAATALTVALTYPLAFNLTSLGRLNTSDGQWSIWVVSWVAHALSTDPRTLFDANIFYPATNALAFSEANLVAGLVGLPVWLLTRNPYATHNVVVLFAFITSAISAYYLARYLTRQRGAAAVAGVLFAFCPYAFARTAHIQLLLTAGLPLVLLAMHRLIDRPTTMRATWLGVCLWLQALACGYYGIFAGLACGLGLIVFTASRRRWRDRDHWIAFALALFVAVTLTMPFVAPYASVRADFGLVRPLSDAVPFSANGPAWLASAAWAHRWWLPALTGFNEVLFPGIMTTALGLGGVFLRLRRPAGVAAGLDAAPMARRDVALFYILLAGLAFWASFGPAAGFYTVLYEAFPPLMSFLRAPARFGILTTLGLAMLAGMTVAALLRRQRAPAAWALALVAIAVVDLERAPLTMYGKAEPFAPAHWVLANLPRGPVASFPFYHQRTEYHGHTRYMLNSTAHWQPLVNGYSDHIPARFRADAYTLSLFPSRDSFSILRELGVRYTLLNVDRYQEGERSAMVDRLVHYRDQLRPIVQDGDVWLFEIVAWPPDGPDDGGEAVASRHP